FSYLDQLMETLAAYAPPRETSGPDFTGRARSMIREAIDRYETGREAETERHAEDLLLAGKLDELTSLSAEETHLTPEVASSVAWAHVLEGNRLADEGLERGGAGADALFTQAYQEFEAGLGVKPDMHEALNNWGNALFNQAKLKEGAEADQLLTTACEKYEAALALKPDAHAALNNWGSALLRQATMKDGAEADRLFAEAEEKFFSAETLRPGASSYNLACMHALRGDADEARRWLEQSKELGALPTRDKLIDDGDLDGIRDEEWFKNFIAELSDQSQ